MRYPLPGHGPRRPSPRKINRARRSPAFEAMEPRQLLTTFYVTNSRDDGPGSLRLAIEQANGDPPAHGADAVELASNYSDGTISPLSPLPPITRQAVEIAEVAIDGSRAGPGADGLVLRGLADTAASVQVGGFGGAGVVVEGANSLVGICQIVRNGGPGVLVSSDYSGVGGCTITRNGGPGIAIDGSHDAAGANTITSNGENGVDVYGGSNTIGGLNTGLPASNFGGGNVISGNAASGVNLDGPGASGNLVIGNLIGTDVHGTIAQGNGYAGIFIQHAPDNRVGGVGVEARNVISGNHQLGVAILGSGSVNEVVEGNDIGVDITGSRPLGNAFSGVYVGDFGRNGDAASSVTIGGTVPGTANVIAANGNAGVWITGAGTRGVVVEGNLIGTDASGTAALGNAFNGVTIDTGAAGNLIGGTVPGAGNVISGNLGHGILVQDASGTLIQRNTIGLNAKGSARLGNGFWGIFLGDAPDTTVGGPANFISGNRQGGVWVDGAGSTGVRVQGNLIGIGGDGYTPLGNAFSGVLVSTGAASGTIIGGPVAQDGNLIDGNGNFGVWIVGPGTAGTVVSANEIGTDGTGTLALGNSLPGVYISGGAKGNTIGGTSPAARNLIASNADGVWITDPGTVGNVVAGNLIGTNGKGTLAIGNAHDGVFIGDGSTGNTIGGTLFGSRNLISGNTGDGVHITGQGTSANVVEGNEIGTDLSGLNPLGNGVEGLAIDAGATGNTIGGASLAAANVISANGAGTQHVGLFIGGQGTSRNLVLGNIVGTDATGTRPLGNGGSGVLIDLAASGNTIGGTLAGSGNLLSGNGLYGVRVRAAGTSGNLIQGNLIGTDRTGTLAIGNALGGALFDAAASDNTLGGTTPGAGNRIAYNGGNGVTVGDDSADPTTGIAILGNSIDSNSGLGIDLGNDGVTFNDSDGHSGPNGFVDYPVLTSATTIAGTTYIAGTLLGAPNTTYRVELFASPVADPSSHGEGRVFLTSLAVTTGAGGSATFSAAVGGVLPGQAISSTATDPAGNTSEFSRDLTSEGASSDVTSQLRFAASGLIYNRSTGLFTGTITLTNIGTSPLFGPLQVVFTRLTAGVSLANAAGTTLAGDPYLIAYQNSLSTGGSITLGVSFKKASLGQAVTYVPKVYEGA